MSQGLTKAIAEGTLKFPEGQPEPTFFHCAVDDCGYKSYGEIAQKYEEKKEPEPEEDEDFIEPLQFLVKYISWDHNDADYYLNKFILNL